MNTFVLLTLIAAGVGAFKTQDGTTIGSENSYSVPIQHVLRENAVNVQALDKSEFELLHRMKTMNPPAEDSVHYYGMKAAEGPGRFVSRVRRSPQNLKFEGGSGKAPPKSVNEQLPGKTGEDGKRFFGGFHDPYYGQGYYGHGGGHHFNPNAGFGHAGYPGNYGGGYPGNFGGYPGNGFQNGASSASASATASGGGIGGGYRPGYGNGGLYSPGYYPGGYGGYGGYPGAAGYPGAVGAYGPTTYPILGPGGFGGPGFFKEADGKNGKVTAGAVSSGGKVSGGVSFD